MSNFRIYFVLFICLSCSHPETNNFSRDNKDNKEITTMSENYSDMVIDNKLDMEIENGVRYVWIEVNGIRLRFIFDTGASSICISPIEASVLYRQGTLKKEDILSVEYFQDATGRISEGTKVNLRTVRIGDVVLENIEATVVDNVNAPLLLGQSVLENFGKIEIDNEKGQIIFK
jgi:aspartyl protease family protein